MLCERLPNWQPWKVWMYLHLSPQAFTNPLLIPVCLLIFIGASTVLGKGLWQNPRSVVKYITNTLIQWWRKLFYRWDDLIYVSSLFLFTVKVDPIPGSYLKMVNFRKKKLPHLVMQLIPSEANKMSL